MLENFFDSEMVRTLLVCVATFLGLFIKAFLDNVKPGKPETALQQAALFIIRRGLNYVSPEELGRKVAARVNPTSPNAARVSDDKPFDKQSALHFSKAVEEAKLNSGAGWDFH